MDDKKSIQQEIRERTAFLKKAARAYYRDNEEIISNLQYDKLYDELMALENETGIIMAGSPTRHVGYETLSDLVKEAHPKKMLSLDKTKDAEELISWLGDRKGMLSWKLDGLTIVLTYRDGKLFKAVTRGNGEVGEVITNNARVFLDLPLEIPFAGETVLRGEAVITYSDFEKINEAIPELEAKYKNPRNLCSGSVRQLNNLITAERNVRFRAFALVSTALSGREKERIENLPDFGDSKEKQMKWLENQGFYVVGYRMVTAKNLKENIDWFGRNIKENDIPSDGLVLSYDDITYGRSLGETAKFPRDSIAFKWRDETAITRLMEIEWSASRTGLINPIALFGPVQLEGTTVSRASLHNLSIVEDLKLGVGDEIEVYKANMIIPQIAANYTKSGSAAPPDKCPVCGGRTRIRDENQVRTLYCTNPKCPAKKIKAFSHFVGRNAMDIDGISESTIEKFTAKGFIKEPADFFRLDRHRKEIEEMEGFGERSYKNLSAAIEKARKTTASRFLYSLGITGIGSANAKLIAKYCNNNWQRIENLSKEELTNVNGIGEVMATAFVRYFADEENRKKVRELMGEIRLEPAEGYPETENRDLEGMSFVITGSLNSFENREELKDLIERRGGRTSGSVSAKTTALINNDLSSGSAKNKKAAELGVRVISEEEFLKEYDIDA
ncbi:MAG: NAD-dependent DNA ligase LigA [Eubacteriales bacterium]|nr:NAD-dependent DNA ligase LigA [Eubacteriales bacterium]